MDKLISADGFKEILIAKSDLLRTGCPDNQYGIFLRKVSQMIDLMPAAEDNHVIHAHWKNQTIIYSGSRGYSVSPIFKDVFCCSYCGRFFCESGFSYCPHCGAKMDEEVKHADE